MWWEGYINITAKGSQEELLAILDVLRIYETRNHERYESKKDCAYICSVRVNGQEFKDLADEEWARLLEEADGVLEIQAEGPYGELESRPRIYGFGLFEAMADAVPGAWFEGVNDSVGGHMEGCYHAELKEGKLYLSEYYIDNDDLPFPEDYADDFQKKVSYGVFCKLFNLDEKCEPIKTDEDESGECVEDAQRQAPAEPFFKCLNTDGEVMEIPENAIDEAYYEFLIEIASEGNFPYLNHEQFVKFCESYVQPNSKWRNQLSLFDLSLSGVSTLGADEYAQAIEQLRKLGIPTYDEYRANFNYDPYVEDSVYDPITKNRQVVKPATAWEF